MYLRLFLVLSWSRMPIQLYYNCVFTLYFVVRIGSFLCWFFLHLQIRWCTIWIAALEQLEQFFLLLLGTVLNLCTEMFFAFGFLFSFFVFMLHQINIWHQLVRSFPCLHFLFSFKKTKTKQSQSSWRCCADQSIPQRWGRECGKGSLVKQPYGINCKRRSRRCVFYRGLSQDWTYPKGREERMVRK